MTPTLLAVILAVLVGGAIYAARRRRNRLFGHDSAHASRMDLGAVSSRWLAEIRRDEPWIGR